VASEPLSLKYLHPHFAPHFPHRQPEGGRRFPDCNKIAQVMPLLKKTGADGENPANYRPISNLPMISKVLERLAMAQLRPHLLSSNNFCPFQSGFCASHSTETALLELLSEVYTAGDDHRFTVVINLDIFGCVSYAQSQHTAQPSSNTILIVIYRTVLGPVILVRPTAVREARQSLVRSA